MAFREYHRATRCDLGGRFRSCRRPLLGQCQYCARGFCDQHGDRFGDRQEVCRRSSCQAKREDLERYDQFKVRTTARNDNNLCGIESCEESPPMRCERCGGHFCGDHLRQQLVEIVSGLERTPEIQRLCTYCVDRLSVWA